MYGIVFYQTARGKAPLSDYMKQLAHEGKGVEVAQIQAYIDRLKEEGMAVNNSYPHTIRKVKDEIYELRPGSNRVFFFYYTGNEFVLLHAYKKESQKTPQNEIEKAIKERKDYLRRN